MEPITQTRKQKQLQRKEQRLQEVADRRHEAEIQARIKRQIFSFLELEHFYKEYSNDRTAKT